MTTEGCGSSQCLVDRFSETLTKQHEVGIESIKSLMTAHHNNIADQIKEFKAKVEKDNDDMWPRLRKAESAIIVIQGAIGPDGLDAKIRKVSTDSLDARSGRNWRMGWREIAIMTTATVLSALIIAHYIGDAKQPERAEVHHEEPTVKKR